MAEEFYMLKKILSLFVLLLIFLGGLVFYLVNPNDEQYKSYYKELIALESFDRGDMESFVNNMNNPVTVKYHMPFSLYLALINMGRYDEAINTVNAHVKYYDYSFCAPYKIGMRLFCRVTDMFWGVKLPDFDKNYWLSYIYFEKGDYKTAVNYNLKQKKQNACYNVKLYSAIENFELAEVNLKECEKKFFEKKSKYNLYQTMGYFYLKQNKLKAAEDYLTRSVRKLSKKDSLYKGNNTTYLLLAELYEKLNNQDKARDYYEKVIKTDSYNYKAQKGLGLVSE